MSPGAYAVLALGILVLFVALLFTICFGKDEPSQSERLVVVEVKRQIQWQKPELLDHKPPPENVIEHRP